MANQHAASLASISSRTRRLSAPSSGAGTDVPEPAVAQRFPSRRRATGGVVGGHLGEGRLDDLAASATEGIEHGLRRRQSGQRVGDRIADEYDAFADETARNRGIVAEGDPLGSLPLGAVAGDPQPDPAGATPYLLRTEAAAGQRGRPRSLDDDVGDLEQRTQVVVTEIDGVGQL